MNANLILVTLSRFLVKINAAVASLDNQDNTRNSSRNILTVTVVPSALEGVEMDGYASAITMKM